ncbi:hypothetical protein J5N97_014045 [Dioscorea zingiberensis]|uniref:Uncharacterized protein n=1 Tax=Dioscorea zingiberensis TaxID=325984 RepID=A0A9D5HJB8_9LILI|nr:hypothetical protein J5N97_014045 [Dioscorea zingiberensis]
MEKMTLGEWFDRMEKYLPTVINEAAGVIIANLRSKSSSSTNSSILPISPKFVSFTRSLAPLGFLVGGYSVQVYGFGGYAVQLVKKSDARSRVDRESDNHQLMLLDEIDVVSSVGTVLHHAQNMWYR